MSMSDEENTNTEVIKEEPNPAEGGEVNPPAEPEGEPEITYTLDGEPAPDPDDPEIPAEAPKWVKETRKINRDQARRIKELESKLAETTAPKVEPIGDKPTLESCEWDEDRFERELDAWKDRKRKHEEAEKAKHAEAEEAQKRWEASVERYSEAKKKLASPDMDDAEAAVQSALNPTQQGILVMALDDPAKMALALYRSPKTLKELAAITDPVQFTARIAKLEGKVTEVKKTPPPPERKLEGSTGAGSVDKTLDKLLEEARRTGDYTKYYATKK